MEYRSYGNVRVVGEILLCLQHCVGIQTMIYVLLDGICKDFIHIVVD